MMTKAKPNKIGLLSEKVLGTVTDRFTRLGYAAAEEKNAAEGTWTFTKGRLTWTLSGWHGSCKHYGMGAVIGEFSNNHGERITFSAPRRTPNATATWLPTAAHYNTHSNSFSDEYFKAYEKWTVQIVEYVARHVK